MIKATVICGGSAVREYDETGKIPSTKWLNAHGGAVDVREFRAMDEYKAYSMGLADSDGWQAVVLTGKVFTKRNDTSTDCKHCKEWRAIFCDRENDVYCPDCGKLILHPEKEEPISNE